MSLLATLLALTVIHEAGHALAAVCLGYRIHLFAHAPFSVGVGVLAPRGMSRTDDLLIALAGPSANLLLLPALWLVSPLAALLSFVFGTFSLLPVRPQDGWRILRALRP